MKKYIIYVISLLLLVSLIILNIYKEKEYTKNLFYMDTYISVKIVSNNKNKVDKALNYIENMFKYYDNLTNRYDINSELSKINNVEGTFNINKDLYNILEYSINYYDKTNGLFNINMGNIIDIWKKYRDIGEGIPSNIELSKDTDINNIKLLGNNKIYVNNVNIDLGGIVKGYVTKLIGEYLDKENIKNYIINAGGNVIVGKKNPYYKIGIEDANDTSKIIDVIKGNNICVVTSGGYHRYYEYNGVRYHHIINPNTNYPSNYMNSVTIISKDCALADILSTTLFLMPIEDGLEYIKNYDAEAIFYSNDNSIIKTEGIKKYE